METTTVRIDSQLMTRVKALSEATKLSSTQRYISTTQLLNSIIAGVLADLDGLRMEHPTMSISTLLC
jgi:predicted transcriptional regulator